MFSPINLEAEVHLIDLDNETIPAPTHPVTLTIRQGIEVIMKGKHGCPEAAVFIDFCEGRVRASVWDELSDPISDEPVVHILKDAVGKPKMARRTKR